MPQELFFVNKTATSASLTRSQRDESKRILSHVQTNRRKQEVKKASRRHARQDGTKNTDDALVGTSNTPTYQTMTVAQFGANEDEVTTRQGTSLSTRSYPAHNYSDPFHCTVASTDAGNHLLLHCNLFSVFRSMYLGEAFAPIAVLSLPSLTGSPSRSPNRPLKDQHASVFINRLKRCVEDRALMYATLAYGSSFLAWTTGGAANKAAGFGLGCEEGNPTPSAEYFLGRALRAVRMRLARYPLADSQQVQPGQQQGPLKKVDPWLMLSIYNLAVTEMWNGMPQLWTRFPQKHAVVVQTCRIGQQACRVHLRALARLVDLAGGWDALGATTDLAGLISETDAAHDGAADSRVDSDQVALGNYLLDTAILSDKYQGLSEYTNPIMVSDWFPGPVPPQVFASDEEDPFPRMGTAFAALDSLSPELKVIMDEIASYCRIAHTAWTRHAETINSTMETWLFRRQQELAVRLTILYRRLAGGNDISPGSPSFRQMNLCICLAALVFLSGCTANVGAQTAANIQAARLRILLTQHLDEGTQDSLMDMNKGLKLWCLSTGALLSVKLPARAWFVETMRKTWLEDMGGHEKVGDTPSKGLKRALEPFLFLPDRQSEGIEEIAGNR